MTAAAPDFEARYQGADDPWDTASSVYERGKRERLVAACGPGPLGAVCDLGCGLGLVAEALAPHATEVVALDGAPTAVAAARERLQPFPHAQARVGTVPDDLPDAAFDLVVISELLYYLDDAALATTTAWLGAHAQRVVAVHWTGSAPDLRRDADAVGAALAAITELRAVQTERTDGYRLDVLERA